MSKQILRLKTNGNPTKSQEARLYKNWLGEWTISTKVQYNNPCIGRFLGPKDSDGFAEVELNENVYLVFQEGKCYKFTVGTTVEIEDTSL